MRTNALTRLNLHKHGPARAYLSAEVFVSETTNCDFSPERAGQHSSGLLQGSSDCCLKDV
jgi:hypothetical protein